MTVKSKLFFRVFLKKKKEKTPGVGSTKNCILVTILKILIGSSNFVEIYFYFCIRNFDTGFQRWGLISYNGNNDVNNSNIILIVIIIIKDMIRILMFIIMIKINIIITTTNTTDNELYSH